MRTTLLMLALVLLSGYAVGSETPVNLVADPGFEMQPDAGRGIWVGTQNAGKPVFERSEERPRSGHIAAMVTCRTGDVYARWVYVTELDVRIPAPVTEHKLAEQARLYSLVMNTALRSPSCAGLTVWGYSDKYSWIDTFNAFPEHVNACLFDANLQPKTFFPSLLRDLESNARAAP
jgi:hypothetical protein